MGDIVISGLSPITIASGQPAILIDGTVTVIQAAAIVSANNSTSTPLAANATFTGLGDDLLGYSALSIYLFTDQASAVNGYQIQFSPDNVNFDDVQSFTVTAGESRPFSLTIHARYFRIVYTNGPTLQGVFRLQTLLHPVAINERKKPLNISLDTDEPAIITHSVITGITTGGGGGYVDVKVSPSGAVQIGGTVATTPPAHASTNVDQIGGAALSEGQQVMAASIPVVIASDQTSLPVTEASAAASKTDLDSILANSQLLQELVESNWQIQRGMLLLLNLLDSHNHSFTEKDLWTLH